MIYAIVLNAFPFQDHHQIVTLFTKERGIVKGIARYSLTKKNALFSSLNPLNEVEVHFGESRGELEKIETVSLVKGHLKLRNSLELLETACAMLKVINLTQLPGKEAPLLYELLKSFLNMLPEAKSAKALFASFQLKTLTHEGLLALTDKCANCHQKLGAMAIADGECYCEKHAPAYAIHFTEPEADLFLALALSTSKSLLKELEVSDELLIKIDQLFTSLK